MKTRLLLLIGLAGATAALDAMLRDDLAGTAAAQRGQRLSATAATVATPAPALGLAALPATAEVTESTEEPPVRLRTPDSLAAPAAR